MREQPDPDYIEPIEGIFTDVFTAVSEPPRFTINDLVPEGFVIVGGPPKGGKSTLTMVFAALVAGYECKALPPDLSVVPEEGNVMIFSYEASAGELREILEKGLKVANEPDGGIVIADDPWMWRLDDEGAVEKMLWWLNHRKPKLAMLDPMRNFHGLDEKDSSIISLFEPLRRWAKDNHSTFMVVHHVSKPPGDQQNKVFAANDLRGTGALFGAADGVLMLTPKGPQGTFGNWHIEATFKRAKGWQRQIQLAAWDVERSHEVLDDMTNMTLRLIKGGPTTQEAIQKQLRIPPGMAQNSLQKLARNGLIKQEGRKWISC